MEERMQKLQERKRQLVSGVFVSLKQSAEQKRRNLIDEIKRLLDL